MEKASSLGSFWWFRLPQLTSCKECVSTVMLCIVIVCILPGKFILEQKIGKKNLSLLHFQQNYVKISKCTHRMVEIFHGFKLNTLISQPLKWPPCWFRRARHDGWHTFFKVNANEFSIVSYPKNDLNDVSSGNLNSQKDHELKVKSFSRPAYYFSSQNVLNFTIMSQLKWLHVHFKLNGLSWTLRTTSPGHRC